MICIKFHEKTKNRKILSFGAFSFV